MTQESEATHVSVEISVKRNVCRRNIDGIIIAVFATLHGDLPGRDLNAKNCDKKCGELIHS